VTLIIVCIVAMAILTSFPTIFMQKALVVVGQFVETGDWAAAMPQVRNIVLGLIGLYVIALVAQFVFTQLGAIVTQGTLRNIRDAMFAHMQDLPIGYFDTHKHGDVMSYYTNDVDVLRQLIGQALPNLLNTILAVVSVIAVMLWYSLPLTLVVACVMALMFWLVKVFGGRGAKFFLA
jgi:ATP-binding cassette subfamily B protein